jgi:hypothetical protein
MPTHSSWAPRPVVDAPGHGDLGPSADLGRNDEVHGVWRRLKGWWTDSPENPNDPWLNFLKRVTIVVGGLLVAGGALIGAGRTLGDWLTDDSASPPTTTASTATTTTEPEVATTPTDSATIPITIETTATTTSAPADREPSATQPAADGSTNDDLAPTEPSAATTPDTAQPPDEALFVTDLEVLAGDGGCLPRTESVRIGDEQFARALVWFDRCSGDESVVYEVPDRFTRLTGTVGFTSSTEIGSSGFVEVWGDGRRLESFAIEYGGSQPIDVDVSDVVQLEFRVLDNQLGEIQAIGDPQVLP